MNDVFWNFINDFVQCYLNDIFIYSKTRKQHVKHVKFVLERFRDVDFQINITKSEFFVKEIFFLSVIVSIESIRMNSKKMQIVMNWMTFFNLKKIQRFLNFCNFYRRFIKNFAKIVKCMNKLIMKNVFFQWIEICDKIFHFFKKRIITISMFRHFDRNKKIILKIDVFDYVNENVFFQYDDDDVFHFVIFFNKNIISIECNYEIYNKKLLIIIRYFEH